MSPNERADRLMTDFMDAEIHESAMAVIAKHIRAAENDALERAAKCADVFEQDAIAQDIRELKHVSVGEELTEKERIKCAYLHLVCGVEQQHLCIAFETNIGRVSEAITAIELAISDPKLMRIRMENDGPFAPKGEA